MATKSRKSTVIVKTDAKTPEPPMLHEHLRELRRKLKLGKRAFCRLSLFGEPVCDYRSYSRYESGQSLPTDRVLKRLLSIYCQRGLIRREHRDAATAEMFAIRYSYGHSSPYLQGLARMAWRQIVNK